jgi:hypothetical protein
MRAREKIRREKRVQNPVFEISLGFPHVPSRALRGEYLRA